MCTYTLTSLSCGHLLPKPNPIRSPCAHQLTRRQCQERRRDSNNVRQIVLAGVCGDCESRAEDIFEGMREPLPLGVLGVEGRSFTFGSLIGAVIA